jgi:hypothetical protein
LPLFALTVVLIFPEEPSADAAAVNHTCTAAQKHDLHALSSCSSKHQLQLVFTATVDGQGRQSWRALLRCVGLTLMP